MIAKSFSACLVLLWIAAHASVTRAITYTSLTYPEAMHTFARGISGERIVGKYGPTATDSVNTRAYVHDGQVWKALSFPGQNGTFAQDIEGDKVVGWYLSQADNLAHGYVYDLAEDVWTPIDVPGYPEALNTFVNGISGDTLVGQFSYRFDPAGPYYTFGYHVTDNVWQAIQYPGSITTSAVGVDENFVVGLHVPAGQSTRHGFIFDTATNNYLNFDFPGAVNTVITDVDAGAIIGWYTDTNVQTHGFLYNSSGWTTLDFPGATGTVADGIDGRQIVGWYTDASGATHGYQATIPEPASLPAAAIGAIAIGAAIGSRRVTRGLR